MSTASYQVLPHGSRSQGTFSKEEAEQLLAEKNGYLWIDLQTPTAETFETLRDVFKFHPLAIEDSEKFGQRAKIDDYDDFLHIVVFGASKDEDSLAEIHIFYSDKQLITVHHDTCTALNDVRNRYEKRGKAIDQPSFLLYNILDGLADSFFPMLSDLDDLIDDLEDQVFVKPDNDQLQTIFTLKRKLVQWRKIVTPQRDMFARVAGEVPSLPGLGPEDERYFRDVYDHMIRISDMIDTYRDLLTGSMDVYLSTVSNQMNTVMQKLTVVAIIFLPLSWFTGFFGQNFTWEGGHILRGTGAFLFGGVIVPTVLTLLVIFYMKRKRWV